MKQLRVLTGLHAGAQLTLIPRQYIVGNDEAADLQITDWRHAPLALNVEEGHAVIQLATAQAGSTADATLGVLEDFVPRRFKDVVLCAGPVDAAWPSDVELMARLLRKPKARPEPRPARRGAMWVLSMACVVTLTLFAGLVMRNANTAQAKVPRQPLQVRVLGSLAQMGFDGLAVREAGRKVVVEGLVPSASDVSRIRASLMGFGDDLFIHKYAAASDIVQSISDALGNPGLNVRYGGRGVFEIHGASVEIERVRGAAQRIAADLGSVVARIDVVAQELPPPGRVSVDAMLVSDGVQYVQTRDGTKHLSFPPAATPDPLGER